MSELRGIYTLWKREVIRLLREKSRLVSSVVTPILWLVIFGTGLGMSVGAQTGYKYQEFLFPGIIGQTLLFTAMFMGISVIWDKQFGFMKEILVAPVSRLSIFIGKMLGVGTNSLLQGIIVYALGFFIGIPITLTMTLEVIPLMILVTIGLVCIGLIIASVLDSLENFGVIMTFVNMPMFFLSGALFPVATLPGWLKWVFYINPLTYGVDALRAVTMGGAWQTILPFWQTIAVIALFDVVMVIVGSYAFTRTK
ncbi:ABC transporter permease protein [Methanocella paludicola SANAE]|uniref:ABC transporter permease protein n=1 Tax=Methanocella paludicola (strain DSM 17711 / JCM 13418 / NBRC 101707 / SANAE) TaxID=304371 RepID=D1Z1Y2_METPS|nr:ABC transporter permease [Methanocella paludicola]BAI62704.1 ABC transporter permease protein [Methanocella paludicola SANAE]